MKLTKTLKAALLALAGIALVNAPAGASLVDPAHWDNGELLLGFRASGGTGSSDSYLVNLGARTLFTGTTAGFTLSLGNIGADLVAKYGSDWFTRNDLYWGIFGTYTSASPTVFASEARSDVSTQSTPWPALSLTERSSTDSQINAVTTAFNLLTSSTNTTYAAFQTNASNTGSYAYQVGTEGTTDFGSISRWGSIEGSFANGTAGTALDLYAIGSTGVTYRGVFGIDNTGTVSFNVVPEPSTVSLALLAGSFFIGSRRRNKTA